MKNKTLFAMSSFLSVLVAVPAFGADDDATPNKDRYRQHYQERHQMNLDMMSMLKDTMTILRDLNQKPSDEEKKRLSDMIKQLDEMIVRHKELGDMWMERPMGMGPGLHR